MRLRAALVLAALAGCSAPSDPTWTRDVKPILQANCIKCHGAVARGGAPDGFRLDTYGGTTTDDGRLRWGATTMARFVHLRTHEGTMPPVAPLTGVQIETLEAWFENAGDSAPAFGAPEPGNRAASAVLAGAPSDSGDGFLALDIEISDPDFDIVTGRLDAVPVAGGGSIRVTDELYSGRDRYLWDAQAAAEGTYTLRATLFDEHREVEVDLGDVEVTHPGGNAAPSAAFVTPGSDALLSLPFAVTVVIDDPDAGDSLEVTLLAERAEESIELASIDNAGRGELTIDVDAAAIEPGGNWRLRVAVSDGATERSAILGPVVFAGGTTSYTWAADIVPIMAGNCRSCHGGVNQIIRVDANFDADTYDLAQGGAFVDYAGWIYRRVVQEQTMPPRSTKLIYDDEMSIEERRILAEYILAGAPCPTGEPGCAEE